MTFLDCRACGNPTDPADPQPCDQGGTCQTTSTTDKGDTMTTSTAAAETVLVGIQHNQLNLSIYRVTPAEDGMETVEFLQLGHPDRDEALALVDQARVMATVTGARSATYRSERRRDGDVVVTHEAIWHRNPWALRLVPGTHKARAILDPAQAALREEAASNPREPKEGDRYIVAELTGYELVQNRSFDHRHCHCGDGVTRYTAGTVVGLTYWADNSREATVQLDTGRKVTVELAPPSGDACF